MKGEVLEAGVGTGRNLEYYHSSVHLTALDFSPAMLKRAAKRGTDASCNVRYVQEDASRIDSVQSGSYDWVVAFFLCCVLPKELQEQAISEFARVLKPGGRFRLLEMKYSNNQKLRKRQDRFAPFVEGVWGRVRPGNVCTCAQSEPSGYRNPVPEARCLSPDRRHPQ